MKKYLLFYIFLIPISVFTQERVIPLSHNPYIESKMNIESNNELDSSFVYVLNSLTLPLFDDFSINKWVDYHKNYVGAGVTSELYFHLLDGNSNALNSTVSFCDSTNAHVDSVIVVDGVEVETKRSNLNNGTEVFIQSLDKLPLTINKFKLFDECFVLIDSVIDGIPNPTQDTLFYTPNYLQDSARVFTATLSDNNEIWVDDFAWHNYHFAINPLSLGVATLDAIGDDGYPYEFGNGNVYGEADNLTSKPIDLSSFDENSGIILSFFYQPKGYGNSPEDIDSLILELYSPDTDIWYNVWAVSGDKIDDEWKEARVEVSAKFFLKDGFKFRFKNKASLSANVDHWHLDYVNFRANAINDTLLDDIAIVYPIESFLNDFTSAPWDHYNNLNDPSDVMRPDYELIVNNNYNEKKLANTGGMQISTDNFVLPIPASLNWNEGMNYYVFNVGNLPYSFPQDKQVDLADFEIKVNVKTSTGNQILENDTTYFTQKFRNYYAYDDGTAESGYGLFDKNAELAYKFEAYESDTLEGILMKFIPNEKDLTGKVFLMTVWADDNGVPGEIIYQDDVLRPHFPDYAAAKNQYHFYKFNAGTKPVVAPKVFYVGWEQIDDDNLYIGFDMNNNQQDKIFYNNGAGWTNGSIPGAMIIRPVFSTNLNYTLNLEKEIKPELSKITVYPNPVINQININGIAPDNYIVLSNISGQKVLETKSSTISFENLNSGFYILSVFDSSGNTVFTDKVIKP